MTLDKVNNTADTEKPISTKTQTVLDLKLNAADTSKYSKQTYLDSALVAKQVLIGLKLNTADTSKYSKQTYLDSALVAKQVLIGLKLNAADTIKYTKQTYLDSAVLTKLKISDTTAMMSSRIARDTLNLSNRINLKANTTDVTTSLSLKESTSNKSTAVDLGGTSPSDILFPTQKAVKDYVAANNSGGGVADGGITTIKIADAAVTDAKINTVSGSKVIGNIVGNAATATLATNATTAGNITATTNTTLTSLSNLATVGTITSGVWSGTAVAVVKGGTGATTASAARTNLGLVVGTDILTPNVLITGATKTKLTYDVKGLITAGADATTADIAASTNKNYVTDVQSGVLSNTTGTNTGDQTITLTGDVTGTGTGTFTSTLANSGVIANTYGSSTSIPTFSVDAKGRVITASTASIVADAGTLTGTTLKSTVTGSSLTSVGTIASLTTGAITNSGKVIVGTSSAASASAVLEASSTTQGFLPPRMTKEQRDAIASPTAGLMIWCSDNVELQVYNGSLWVNMNGITNQTLTIGKTYQGGIIAYILVSGDPGYDENIPHGLIATTSDQSTVIIRWYKGSFTTTGATGTVIGTGLSNTNTIITSQGATSTSYAAGWARAYTDGGYTDWYLPSKDELNKLYINRTAIGGFADYFYWSSSEYNVNHAWFQYFGNGLQYNEGKAVTGYVRAIRAF